MKVMCKRTYFVSDMNVPLFKKNKYYEILEKGDFFLKMMTEDRSDIIFNRKNFDKFFIDISELRDIKINEVFKR